MKNLKITLFMGNGENDRDWYYGHPEVRNLGGNMISEDVNTPRSLKRGLYSLEVLLVLMIVIVFYLILMEHLKTVRRVV